MDAQIIRAAEDGVVVRVADVVVVITDVETEEEDVVVVDERAEVVVVKSVDVETPVVAGNSSSVIIEYPAV